MAENIVYLCTCACVYSDPDTHAHDDDNAHSAYSAQDLRPHVIVSYNGDFFDWPYLDSRCKKYRMSLYKELGIRGTKGNDAAAATD